LPRDTKDHERDPECDQRIAELEADRDDAGTEHDGEADVGVRPGVSTVRYQRRAV
jgi:hypothetical protein